MAKHFPTLGENFGHVYRVKYLLKREYYALESYYKCKCINIMGFASHGCLGEFGFFYHVKLYFKTANILLMAKN